MASLLFKSLAASCVLVLGAHAQAVHDLGSAQGLVEKTTATTQAIHQTLQSLQKNDRLYQQETQSNQKTADTISFDGKFKNCQHEFTQAQAPTLVGTKGQKLNKSSYALCFNGFATLYSGVTYTPLWSASYLTKKRVQDAKTLTRVDNFHPELQLPKQARAELADYRRSGMDRGHIAPNGDMATPDQQYDSFSLANIAPQNSEHNRNIWRQIESVTRDLAVEHREIYVVTGVAFLNARVSRLNAKVVVPSHFFKAVYIPSLGAAGVYYSANDAAGDYQIISLHELAELTGINAMPSLPRQVQATAYPLPRPDDNNRGSASKSTPKTTVNEPQDWLSLILRILEILVDFLPSKA